MLDLCGRTAPIEILLRRLEAITGGWCCMGAAEYGFDRCTCWEPVYDLEQSTTPRPDIEPGPATRSEMCVDCAFRPDSPERSGDERYDHADGDLSDLTHFWCHQGIRKPIAWRHPAGITVTCDVDAYDPPVRIIDGEPVPLKADSTPADRCAGFAAYARAREAKAASQ